MAGILKRFGDIMSANINALLDKAEDPSKMIDQYLRDMQSDMGEVKAQTAAVMAEEKRCKRELDECDAEIAKMMSYAEKALTAGNEADARQFLAKKQEQEAQKASLDQAYQFAKGNADKMRGMHDKLQKDIAELESRKAGIKAKIAAAKTQEKINTMTSGVDKVGASMSAFDRMEDKADAMLDQAAAMSELNSTALETSMEELESKYSGGNDEKSVDDDLAALKAKLGM